MMRIVQALFLLLWINMRQFLIPHCSRPQNNHIQLCAPPTGTEQHAGKIGDAKMVLQYASRRQRAATVSAIKA